MIDQLNNSVWATLKPSKIHGIGVFAIRDIPKDTRITNYSIHKINDTTLYRVKVEDFESILPDIRELILDRNMFQDWQDTFNFYSPNCEQTLQSFTNHSNDPNSSAMIALREIKKGEEITQDYRKMFGEHKPHKLITKHHAY